MHTEYWAGAKWLDFRSCPVIVAVICSEDMRLRTLLVLLLLVCWGCSSKQNATPAEPTNDERLSAEIVGIWQANDGNTPEFYTFHPDGSFATDDVGERRGGGSWNIENSVLMIHSGFGTTGANLDIPINIDESGMQLVFNETRIMKRNLDMEQQYNHETDGRLGPLRNRR